MDRRDHKFLCLDICNRLYNFMSRWLTTHALKTVTLGHPVHHVGIPLNGIANQTDQTVHPRARDDTANEDAEEASYDIKDSDPFASLSSSSKDHEQDCKGLHTVQDTDGNIHEQKAINSAGVGKAPEEEASLPSLPPKAKPPMKVVSINDRAEEIKTSQRKVKRSKSAVKTTSMERKEDVPKPLKSILKVGSSIGENQNSFATLVAKDEL